MFHKPKLYKNPKKSIHHTIKKKKLTQAQLIRCRKFLYTNHKLLLKHRTFLHHYHNYAHGNSNEFDDSDDLRVYALHQGLGLNFNTNYHQNQGGRIPLYNLSSEPITY